MDFRAIMDINFIVSIVILGIIISKKMNYIVEIRKTVLTFILISIIIPFINIIFGVKLTYHFIEFMTIGGLVYYFEIKDFNISLFIASIFSLSFSVCRYILIFTYVTCTFYLGNEKILNTKTIIIFQVIVLSLIILFIIFTIYLINIMLENMKFNRKLISTILVFLVIVLITGTVFDVDTVESELVYRASICSIFIAIYMGIICICLYKKYQDIKLKSQVSLLKNQLYYQERYYEKVLKGYEYARRAKHDLNNHINVMRYLLETKDYVAMEEYLNRINEFILDNKEIKVCGNKIINAICVEKIALCRNKKIKIDFDIDIPGDINMNLLTLCIVYGNLLDNAIEACERISDKNIERFIDVISFLEFDKLYLKVVNSKDISQKNISGRFITSKSDKKNHGLGLGNVMHVVNKNKGYVDFKDLNDVFEVNLYMNLKNNNE